MLVAEKPIKSLNYTRLAWLLEGSRANGTGLDQDDNPYKPEEEDEAFNFWLFGWTYAHLQMLERN